MLLAQYRPEEALLRAQRWWKNEIIPQLRVPEASNQVSCSLLGVSISALGPTPEAEIQSAKTEMYKRLCAVTAWSGYRFVGVSGRKAYTKEEYEIRRETYNRKFHDRGES